MEGVIGGGRRGREGLRGSCGVVGQGDVDGECRLSVGDGDHSWRVCGGDYVLVLRGGFSLAERWFVSLVMISGHTVRGVVVCCNNRSSLSIRQFSPAISSSTPPFPEFPDRFDGYTTILHFS